MTGSFVIGSSVLGTSGASTYSYTLDVAEGLSLLEEFAPNWDAVLAAYEFAPISDEYGFDVAQSSEESFSVLEYLSHEFDLSTTYEFGVTDFLASSQELSLEETALAIQDFLDRGFHIDSDESLSVSEDLWHDAVLGVDVSLTVSQTLTVDDTFAVSSETFGISEGFENSVWLESAEGLSVSESLVSEMSTYWEEISSLLDDLSHVVDTPVPETFGVEELTSVSVDKPFSYTVGAGDTFSSVWSSVYSADESFSVSEDYGAEILIGPFEYFSIADLSGVIYTPSFSETVSFGEAVVSVATKSLTEVLAVASSLSSDQSLTFYETLALFDELVRSANAVFADICLSSAPMDLNAFKALVSGDTPLGFSPWRDLNPGDFEFKDALVGIILSREDPSTDVRVHQSKVSVDVPDIVETGTAIVSDTGWTTVTFTRPFHVVEEVIATLISGGTLAIPEIRDGYTTNTSFQVRLRQSDNPANQVSGKISFSAKGY